MQNYQKKNEDSKKLDITTSRIILKNLVYIIGLSEELSN